MNEHRFKIDAPFHTVVDTLVSMSGVDIVDASELYCIGALDNGAGVIARPAYLDATDVIVAEPEGHTGAAAFTELLAGRLGRQGPLAQPLEPA